MKGIIKTGCGEKVLRVPAVYYIGALKALLYLPISISSSAHNELAWYMRGSVIIIKSSTRLEKAYCVKRL